MDFDFFFFFLDFRFFFNAFTFDFKPFFPAFFTFTTFDFSPTPLPNFDFRNLAFQFHAFSCFLKSFLSALRSSTFAPSFFTTFVSAAAGAPAGAKLIPPHTHGASPNRNHAHGEREGEPTGHAAGATTGQLHFTAGTQGVHAGAPKAGSAKSAGTGG